jgi:hypothetical protein
MMVTNGVGGYQSQIYAGDSHVRSWHLNGEKLIPVLRNARRMRSPRPLKGRFRETFVMAGRGAAPEVARYGRDVSDAKFPIGPDRRVMA